MTIVAFQTQTRSLANPMAAVNFFKEHPSKDSGFQYLCSWEIVDGIDDDLILYHSGDDINNNVSDQLNMIFERHFSYLTHAVHFYNVMGKLTLLEFARQHGVHTVVNHLEGRYDTIADLSNLLNGNVTLVIESDASGQIVNVTLK